METVAIALGIALVIALGVIGWLATSRVKLAQLTARATAEAEQARLDAERTESRRVEEVSKLEGIEANLRATLEEADAARQALEVTLATEREQRDSDRKIFTARENSLREEQTRLQNWLREQEQKLEDRFAKLSSEALDANTKRFMEQAKESFAGQAKLAQSDLESRQKAVDALVKPIGETLAKTEERLVQLSERVESTTAASDHLRHSTDRLVRAFSRPEVRGRYGEIQLRRVAELAGMVPYCDFTEQSTTRDDEGRALRPDMIVQLPNDCEIVVDAKCNIDAYVKAVEAMDATEREQLLEKFASDVASQAGKLSKKSYWAQYEGSPDFVVMFIPGDHFLDAALSRRPDLIERSAEAHVILASPATLIGLLRAVHVGWREHDLAEQAKELFRLGGELHDRSAIAFKKIDELGSLLGRATTKYNEAIRSISARLMPTLRKFEDAGAKSAKELPDPCQVNVLPASAGTLAEPDPTT